MHLGIGRNTILELGGACGLAFQSCLYFDLQLGMPSLGSMLSSNFDPYSIFGLGRQNWWEGPNVCVKRKVLIDDEEHIEEEEEAVQGSQRAKFFAMDMSFTNCRDDYHFHECTTTINRNGQKKTVTVRNQCCYGFERAEDGTTGCTKMVMEELSQSLENMEGVEEFAELLKENSLMDGMENITVFVPSNEAIEDFRHDLQHINVVENERDVYNIDDGLSYRKKRDITIVETPALDEILKAHMVQGFLDTASIQDEQIVNSVNGNKIRMTVYNTYPQRAVMANCAKVTSRDHYSTNGIVHIVDKVILPATKTLRQMIETDVQFTTLKSLLEKNGLMDKMDEAGQLTLFAPNNKAFENLDSEMMKKLEKSNGCSKDVLLHHLLPNVICTGVIEGKAKTTNVNKKYVILERNPEDELTVDEANIVNRDIMASNGVMHIIDQVLVPETARTIEEALDEHHRTTLEELLSAAGINEALSNMSNVTFFAPSEKALSALSKDMLEELKSNPEQLKEFLMYHIATPKTCQCDMSDNKVLKSAVRDQKLRINAYGSLIPFMDQKPNILTVQCAKITNLDDEICGGMIHTVDKILTPPIGNLMDLIKLDAKHTTWLELVQIAQMEEELNSVEGPLTMLAPTDGAFDNMDDELKEKIFADKELATQVVKHHVLKEMLCCAGITRNFMFFDQSTKFTLLDDDVVNVRRSPGGYLYADRAELTTCDMVANNGVVHAIDRVLLPLGIAPKPVVQERSGKSLGANNYRFNPMQIIRNPFRNFNIQIQ